MAMKKEIFITSEDFNALTAPTFQVEHVYLVQTKCGKQLVLVLTNHDGKVFQMYAANPIKNELKDFSKNLPTTT